MQSGEVELVAHEVEILNASARRRSRSTTTTFRRKCACESRARPAARADAGNLRLRHRAAMAARALPRRHGFIDIETPLLYKSTPRARANSSCPRACTTATSTRCRSRRSSSSRC
jgi:aspartyl-tRNA synthetase